MLSNTLYSPQAEVPESSPIVQALRPFAHVLPGRFWQAVTWPTFFASYTYKAAASPFGFLLLLLWCVSLFVTSDFTLLTEPVSYALLFGFLGLVSNNITNDYGAFLTLGPGGTPSTFTGFKRVTLLGWSGCIDIFVAPPHTPCTGYLKGIAERDGLNPNVGGIAPQRQTDQQAPRYVFESLLACLNTFAEGNAKHLRQGTSFLEKCTSAILAKCDCVNDTVFRTFGCEITHPHHVDGSLHVMLHPADIDTVITAGWGERHPLARANPLWTAWFFITEARPPVPENLMFIYAPRTADDVRTVMRIIEAGAKFVPNPRMSSSGAHEGCANHHPLCR